MDSFVKSYFRFLMLIGGGWLFIVIGTTIVMGLMYSGIIENVKFPKYIDLIPSLGILIGGQIAGLAVYINLNHAKEQKKEERKKEELKNKKILNAYYMHFKELALGHKDFLESLESSVVNNPNLSLEELMLDRYYYSDEINTSIYVKPLESMLSNDLHKFTNEDEIVLILSFREKVLNIMHKSKLGRELFIEKNKREEYLEFVKDIKKDSAEILQLLENKLELSKK